MPHNPNDPITVRGGSLEIELPISGMTSMAPRKLNHMAFRGHDANDHITRIVVRNADGSVAFETVDQSKAAKCTVEVFFDHPPRP
jgi:hypothetical protein